MPPALFQAAPATTSEPRYCARPQPRVSSIDYGRGVILPKRIFHFIDHKKSKEVNIRKQINGIVQRNVHQQRMSGRVRFKGKTRPLVARPKHELEPPLTWNRTPSSKSNFRSICPNPSNTVDEPLGRRLSKASKHDAHDQVRAARPRYPIHLDKHCRAVDTCSPGVTRQLPKALEDLEVLPRFVGSAMDPFETLPGKVTRTEQFLISNYLNALPELLYGIRKNAVFNPNRDMIFPQVYKNEAIFQWCLSSIASFFRIRFGMLNEEYILRRRSMAIRLTNETLSDPKREASDGMLLSITAAVLVESRYGDPKTVRSHVDGLKAIINRKGGIPSLVGKPWHTCVVQGFHLAGGGLGRTSEVHDVKELRLHTDDLIETLTDIQRADDERRSWSANRTTQEEDVPGLPYATMLLLSNHKRFSASEEHAVCRRASFSRGAPLYIILSTAHETYNSTPYTSQHCFLAVLLSLNIALWEYRNDDAAVTYYLRTLTRGLRRNSRFDETGTIANIETLNWHLVNGGLDVRGEDGGWVQEEFDRKWKVIDAMTVLARVEPETREMVQEALYGFLVDETHEEMGDVKSDDELEGEEERSQQRRRKITLDGEMMLRIRKEALAGLD